MGRVEERDERITSGRKRVPPAGAPRRRVTRPRAVEAPVVAETQGEHLARLIHDAGLNNNTLAKLAGVRRESISRVVNDHAGLERAPAGTRSTAEAAPAHALGVLRSADGARVRVPGMRVMTMRSRRRGVLRMHDTLQAEAVDREGQQQEKAQQVSESLHAQFA